jgi:hypothetical protein
MKWKIACLLTVFLFVSCASQTPRQTPVAQPLPEPPQTPVETPPAQPEPVETTPETPAIPSDIQDLLEKGKTELKSYYYTYQSPTSKDASKIYVKSNKIKIVPPSMVNVNSSVRYNTIYLDTDAQTAEAYCLGYSDCGNNLGKVMDLNYKSTYIKTPLDWLAEVTEAQKLEEHQVEGRNSLDLQTNIGIITVEERYGFLYKIVDGNKVWEFRDAAFNSVQDSDVVPP